MISYIFDGKTLWVNDEDSGQTITIYDVEELKKVLKTKSDPMSFNLKEKIPNDVPYHFKFVIEDYEEYLTDSSIEITDDNHILIKLYRNDKEYKNTAFYHSLEVEIHEDYYGFLHKHHPEVTEEMIIVKEATL